MNGWLMSAEKDTSSVDLESFVSKDASSDCIRKRWS